MFSELSDKLESALKRIRGQGKISEKNVNDALKDYVKKDGLTWTVTWEEPGYWKNPVAKLYGIRSIPSMYLLDKQGKVLHTGLRGEALAKALADLFPEKEK